MGKIASKVQSIAIGFIQLYRYLLSPLLGESCRFYPSCSCYGIQAIKSHGLMKGFWFLVRRLLRCHPWHPGGFDPVPRGKN